MADGTGIEWTEATWNPVVGCTHVSPGCDNCYAARDASTRLAHTDRYAGLAVNGRFTGEVRLVDEVLYKPLSWRRPRLIFVNSMSDLFHDRIPVEYIARVFAVMAVASRHTYQVLTKRHARMRSVLSDPEFVTLVAKQVETIAWDPIAPFTAARRKAARASTRCPLEWPLPNVWVGVSVEDQQWADIRIPALLGAPAAVRFVSAEPLLGPVRLRQEWLVPPSLICGRCGTWTAEDSAALAQVLRGACRQFAAQLGEPAPAWLDWVIVGGESGPAARPMHRDWARALRDQCVPAGVPYLFKQWGEWSPVGSVDEGGTHVIEPNGVVHGRFGEPPSAIATRAAQIIARLGKKRAGRELDGRTWDEYPAVAG